MPKFRVPVKIVVTEFFIIEASNKEEAMDIALDEDNDNVVRNGDSESDPEVYYPDIEEIEQ